MDSTNIDHYDVLWCSNKRRIDMDVYEAMPMPDGDPLMHLTITIIIIALWYLITWIYYKIEDYTNWIRLLTDNINVKQIKYIICKQSNT